MVFARQRLCGGTGIWRHRRETLRWRRTKQDSRNAIIKLDFEIAQLINILSPIYQFGIFAKFISFKTKLELNRVSIFFHEIFRINVELDFDLKFWSGILS